MRSRSTSPRAGASTCASQSRSLPAAAALGDTHCGSGCTLGDIVAEWLVVLLSVGRGIAAALEADTASLVAWQAGMYGWMAVATFAIFHRELDKTDPIFWFMMQIAMLAGLVAAWPVNAWLIAKGVKERM